MDKNNSPLYKEEEDELFHFDYVMGRILDGLAGAGVLIVLLAIGYFWG